MFKWPTSLQRKGTSSGSEHDQDKSGTGMPTRKRFPLESAMGYFQDLSIGVTSSQLHCFSGSGSAPGILGPMDQDNRANQDTE